MTAIEVELERNIKPLDLQKPKLLRNLMYKWKISASILV